MKANQKAMPKKRMKLPRKGSVVRMVRRKFGNEQMARYLRELQMGREFPVEMREVTLCRMHPKERQVVLYYPDARNFNMMREPNRQLPLDKFFTLFRNKIDDKILEEAYAALTNYRLFFGKRPEDFIEIYSHETVHSCESSGSKVMMYSHPANNIQIAGLYAPGSATLVARTLVNTEEKWYVKLYGDKLLVEKLHELGYTKFERLHAPFRMYARTKTPPSYNATQFEMPFLDIKPVRIIHHPETFDPTSGLFEVTVAP